MSISKIRELLAISTCALLGGILFYGWKVYDTLQHTDLVISHYKESLEPLLSSPTYAYFHKIYLYNKGPAIDNTENLPSNVQIIELDNVGCESHTYLYHILTKREELAEKTFFLPGSFYSLWEKKKIMRELFPSLIQYESGFSGTMYSAPLQDRLHDFHINQYQHSDKRNIAPDDQLTPCCERPYGIWYQKNFDNRNMYFETSKGIFFVSRSNVLNHSQERYASLIAYLDKDRIPEVGHYMERSWAALFLSEN